MIVKVILHSILRDRLPPESHGRADLEVAEGSTVADIYRILDIPAQVACALNGQIERDHTRALVDGDETRFFRGGAGG